MCLYQLHFIYHLFDSLVLPVAEEHTDYSLNFGRALIKFIIVI